MSRDEHSFFGMLYHPTQIVILTLQKKFILFNFLVPFSLVEALRKRTILNQIFNHNKIKKKKWQDPSNNKNAIHGPKKERNYSQPPLLKITHFEYKLFKWIVDYKTKTQCASSCITQLLLKTWSFSMDSKNCKKHSNPPPPFPKEKKS